VLVEVNRLDMNYCSETISSATLHYHGVCLLVVCCDSFAFSLLSDMIFLYGYTYRKYIIENILYGDNSLIFLLPTGKLKRFCLAVIPRDQNVNEVVDELWVGCCNVL